MRQKDNYSRPPAPPPEAGSARPGAARLLVVDALRGTALLGILLVHLRQLFVFGGLPAQVLHTRASGALNDLVTSSVDQVLANKFYGLFSLLFGLGFALMLSRAREAPAVFYRRYARRLLVLGGIGVLHYLHWRGDILVLYAGLGAGLLLFNLASDKVVLAAALVLTVNLPGALVAAWALPAAPLLAAPGASDYYTLASGSYADTIRANVAGLGGILAFLLHTGRIYKTLGFFLFGLYAGRRHFFQQPEAKRPLFGWLLIGILGLLASTKGLSMWLTHTYGAALLAPPLVKVGYALIYDVRDALITLLYVAGLTLFFQSGPGRWVAAPLATVGRMALTNYLFQTLAGSVLLFGYGFGLLTTVPVWAATLLSVPIFLFQLWGSRQWLRRFRYGPVEWLWRSLTYGERQPLRRQPSAWPLVPAPAGPRP